MKTLSILEGKNKYKQIVASAAKGEPQISTKNGKETAVIISYEEFRRRSLTGQSLSEFMLDNPVRKYGSELDLSRSDDVDRDIDLFGDDD